MITVVELSKAYYMHARSTGAVLELGMVTAVMYLAMSYPLSVYVGRMELTHGAGTERRLEKRFPTPFSTFYFAAVVICSSSGALT